MKTINDPLVHGGALPSIPTSSTSFRAGVGLKPAHYRCVLEQRPAVGFFEVHAENYMGAGGPPHRYLSAIREHYPLSLHGVGLSIGAVHPLSEAHLRRLKILIDRYQPAMFSEHLAWSTHASGYLNDLLPIPYTHETLARVVEHIDTTQTFLGRQLLLENPSTYIRFAESTYSEPDFINEVARRTGCGVLLDINNVYVSAINHGFDPYTYIDAIDLKPVGEIHLAGHAEEADIDGSALLIDTHDRYISDAVWSLYAYAIRSTEAAPTMIEWDANIPEFDVLLAQSERANAIAQASSG
jgi:uncharacterized protein (UPF0276 family)